MQQRLSRIKLLALDVDGTLTDGSIIVSASGQTKIFSVYDGLGIKVAMSCGLKIAWITYSPAEVVADRARSLGITDLYQNTARKTDALKELAERYGLAMDEIAYMGDDLNDLPALDVAGFAIAPANAVAEVRRMADLVTDRSGGHGAVREAVETILKARGDWEEALERLRRVGLDAVERVEREVEADG